MFCTGLISCCIFPWTYNKDIKNRIYMQHTILLVQHKYSTTKVYHQNDDFFHCQRKKNGIKITRPAKVFCHQCYHCSCCPTWTELLSTIHVLQLSSSHLLLSQLMLRCFSPRILLLHFNFIVIIALTASETGCCWLKTELWVKNLIQMNYFFWTRNCLVTKLFCSTPTI